MNNVKSALTRKFGPLPAWVWFAGAFLVIYFYRKYRAVGGISSGTGTGSVAPASGPPQAQTPLQPGESVYDPNTGALLTAPGNPTDTSNTGQSAADLGAAMDNLAGAIATGMPPEQVHVTMPQPAQTTQHTSGTKQGKSHKTTKRVPKPKIKGKTKPAKHKNPAHKPAGRSSASVRNSVGGRTNRRAHPPQNQQPRAQQAPSNAPRAMTPIHGQHPAQHGQPGKPSHIGPPAPSRARQRPRVAPVTTISNQRRPAVTPAPAPRSSPAPAPRPSAPPPRTQRTPAPPVHRPAPVARRRK